MIDRGGPEHRPAETTGRDSGDGFANRQDENTSEQGRGVVMRAAPVIMTRATITVVMVVVGMGQALRVGGNFPMLDGMGNVGQGEHDQTGQPEGAQVAGSQHGGKINQWLGGVNVDRGVCW